MRANLAGVREWLRDFGNEIQFPFFFWSQMDFVVTDSIVSSPMNSQAEWKTFDGMSLVERK